MELAKRYLINNAFKEEISQAKIRSFEAQSKTVYIKRRPKTGTSTTNLKKLSNDTSKSHVRTKSNDPKIKFNQIIE